MWSRTPVSTDSLSRRVIKQCNHHSDGIIIAMPRRHLAGKAEGLESWLLFVDRGLRCALGRPSCSGSPSHADWTGYAGWIGSAVSRARACSLAALDQLPAAESCKLVGKDRSGSVFFFFFWGIELSRRAVVTCQQRVLAFEPTFLIRMQLPTFWLLESLNTMKKLATGVVSVDVMYCGPDSRSCDKLWGCTPCLSIGQRPTA